jgi:hypothetical protein
MHIEWLNLSGGITTHSTGAGIARLSFARLDAWLIVSRPVNSGVMSTLRIQLKKSPAAPQLNDDQLVWIMREAG